jgi:hypothetical protein
VLASRFRNAKAFPKSVLSIMNASALTQIAQDQIVESRLRSE